MVINWLIKLAVSEKLSHNFFSLKGDSLCPPHWVMITRTSLGKGPAIYFRTLGGSILTEDLVGPKTLGDLQPLMHTTGRC